MVTQSLLISFASCKVVLLMGHHEAGNQSACDISFVRPLSDTLSSTADIIYRFHKGFCSRVVGIADSTTDGGGIMEELIILVLTHPALAFLQEDIINR